MDVTSLIPVFTIYQSPDYQLLSAYSVSEFHKNLRCKFDINSMITEMVFSVMCASMQS